MQQINLYRDILNQQNKASDIQLVTVGLVAIVISLLCISAYEVWDYYSIQADLEGAQRSFSQDQAKVNDLISKRPSQDVSRELLAEIDQWQSSVNEAAQTLQLLSGRKSQVAQGFSSYFDALTNYSGTDVWLTNIQIDGQSRAISIQGSTFKPEQIPRALLELQQQPALKGQTFAKLAMEQSSQVAGQIDFILSSSEQSSSERKHAQ
ncbi:MAG: PilN domain-containing protein [Methylococcales bacterium]|nr:hypothetical protein [Methylococcaceae bacterium]